MINENFPLKQSTLHIVFRNGKVMDGYARISPSNFYMQSRVETDMKTTEETSTNTHLGCKYICDGFYALLDVS